MVIDKDVFLSMMVHYKRLQLKELVEMDWEKEKLSVEKIKDIQKEIMGKGYAHLLPFTIRDLLINEKQQKPDVDFFIEDATHRSIALADLLVKERLNQAPITVFYGTLKEGY
jgi:hypothetical protein